MFFVQSVHVLMFVGKNHKMKLSGRFKKIVGVLSTSILYSLHEKLYAFYPSVSGCDQWGVVLELTLRMGNVVVNFRINSFLLAFGYTQAINLTVLEKAHLHVHIAIIPFAFRCLLIYYCFGVIECVIRFLSFFYINTYFLLYRSI